MMHHWSHWLIILGISMDVIDGLTTPTGGTGGILYGANGPLASLDASNGPLKFIGSMHIGEMLAAVGVIAAVATHGFKKGL